ncbi:hypothetical protein D6D01_06846 [Aureobasidium pullulans]|uniref:Uncharacterized protein n=1 Tax=Aureobasidium pullulans TaxID=5580 RepID=A0A4S9KUU3_AURPU|nr:hypothetical protein D6D01_06846 [Aureobasidium pullulans]
MRFLSIFTAAVLSLLAIASPLSNADKDNLDIAPRATTCNKSHLYIFNDDVKYGIPFCQFYFAIPRTRSPIPGLSTQEVYDICKCITDGQFQPAARVGDNSPRSSFSVVTRTIRSTVTVARTTVALTTARSVPIRTTGVSTVTEKQTIRTTVTARPTDSAKVSTVTIAKSTITIKASGAGSSGAGNANGKSTITVAKTTITLKPTAAAKTSTVTIARTTITAKASGANGSGNGASASKSTITVAKSTITVAKSTITQKSTVTIAKTTITAQNQNASPTTMFKTVTLSAVGSGQKTVTIAKSTVTVKPSSTARSTAISFKTVTSVRTVGAAQSTVTVAKTTITAKASSAAQSTVVSVRTVTSVRTVGAQTTATRVVTSTFYPSIITITNTQTQAGTQAATTATTVITLGSGSGSSSVSSSGTALGGSAGAPTTAAPSSAAASSASGTAASSTVDPRSTCSLQPTSTPPASIVIADTEYERFYRGCGFTEDPNNPGNAYFSDNFPPVVTRIDSTVSPSDAVQQCAEDAYYRYDDPNQYLSFDLHFISNGTGLAGEGGSGYWECVQYFSEQSDTDASPYFNVTNSAVTIAYGYSSGLYSDAAAVAASKNSKRTVVESNEVSESSHFHPKGRGQKLAQGSIASNLTRTAY